MEKVLNKHLAHVFQTLESQKINHCKRMSIDTATYKHISYQSTGEI